MKNTLATLLAAGLLLLASLVWAAPAVREDNSSTVMWGFLGFCALIVVAQVIPAIRDARRAAAEEKQRLAEFETAKARIKE